MNHQGLLMLAAGMLGVAGLWFGSSMYIDSTFSQSNVMPIDQASEAVLARLDELESAYDERAIRQEELVMQVEALERQIAELTHRSDGRQTDSRELMPERNKINVHERSGIVESVPAKTPAQRRQDRLVKAGFDSESAAYILRRENELRMKVMEERYELMRQEGGAGRGEFRKIPSVDQRLRQEMGDSDYDRYLYASGRSNRVRVGEVIGSSPGELAGLKAGDVVLSYSGEAVFSMGDIVRLTREGPQGESVSMVVRRKDGTQTTLYLPRGPIGMSSGRGMRVNPD